MGRTRLRHIRHQRVSRVRKSLGDFATYLATEAARLTAPVRAVRDRLTNVGPLSKAEVSAAADRAAAGIVFSTAATVTFTASSRVIARGSGSFLTDGFAVGDLIRIGGTANNNRDVTIEAVVALSITTSQPIADEAAIAATIHKINSAARE